MTIPNPSETGLFVYAVSVTGSAFSGATYITNNVSADATSANPVLSGDNATSGGSTAIGIATYQNQNYTETTQYIGTASSGGKIIGFIVYDAAQDTYFLATTTPFSGTSGALNISSGANDPRQTDNWNLNSGMAACFLEGTRIATPAGETAIEALEIGDSVTVLEDGETVARPVIWIGHRGVDLKKHDNNDAYPVRIKAGAFAEMSPRRDLLITSEHCIYVNGGLLPARMLVNDRSIFVDRNISSFTYYHIELDQHGILLAEGLTTESYLDTGNRGNFANAKVSSLHVDLAVKAEHAGWRHSAAPLQVDQASVEPVWQSLNNRAQLLGFAKRTAEAILSSDPAPYLVTSTNGVIRPLRKVDDRYLFMLPADETELYLVSRTARPCDTIGPFMNDRRELGVLVGRITLYEGRKTFSIKTHLASANLAGWHESDRAAHRWTDGNAKLPKLPAEQHGKAAILEIQIVHAGPYMLDGQALPLSALAA